MDDKLHLTPQAELIISGNIAQQLGYAGRTAGLKRWQASEFPLHAADLAKETPGVKMGKKGGIELKGNCRYPVPEGIKGGCTVELRFTKKGYGNGAKGGWVDDKPLTLTLTANGQEGTLSIGESFLRWGDGWGFPLYSADMSSLTESLRIAYVPAVPEQQLAGGFYVWLGDMLIGEALKGAPTTAGDKLEISSSSTVRLARLDFDPRSAWSPVSRRYYKSNPLIVSKKDKAEPLSAVTGRDSARKSTPPASHKSGVQPRVGFSVCRDMLVGNINAVLGLEESKPVTPKEGESPINALCRGAHKGSIHLKVDDSYSGTQPWAPFFAAFHCSGIAGGAALEVNAESFHVTSGTFWGESCSLIGTIKASVTGPLRFVLRRGQYEGNIYGGPVAMSQSSTVGSTYIELGEVRVGGNVYAGGSSGIVKGDAAIVIDGAARLESRIVCAGGHMGLEKLDGGKILGDSSITLRRVGEDSPMADYSGRLSGGRNVEGKRRLILDGVKAGKLKASLSEFDEIHLKNGSKVILSGLGNATRVVVDATSTLGLTEGSYEAAIENEGSIVLARGCKLRLLEPGGEGIGNGRYVLRKGAELNSGKLRPNITRS